jgi:hypothetical protein
VAITTPVPRPAHRFWRWSNRWMTISRHPEPCADPLPSLAVRSTLDVPFHSKCLPAVSPANPRSELGPRSLDPDPSFWRAFAELIRDQTSPTDFCNNYFDVRATRPSPALAVLAGTKASTFFLFFLPTPLPCGSGEEWRAALCTFELTPVLVPPSCPGLPNRDVNSPAPPTDPCEPAA